MKNKLISKYILIALSLLTFGISCNKRLDIAPLNILTSDQIFQSESGITAYMASLYSLLPTDDFLWDETRGGGGQLSDQTDEAIAAFATQSVTIPDGTWFPWWRYDAIRNVNDLMNRLPTANITEDEKQSFLGEAKFLRAFYYFGLVKRYGGVPIIKDVQHFTGSNLSQLQPPRNTEKDVYDFIATDLDSAALLLPETNDLGRANKYAALALKSQAMLYAASVAKYGTVSLNGIVGIPSAEANNYWKASFDAAQLLINSGIYSLYNKNPDKALNFSQLFIDAANPENIFAVYYKYPGKVHGYDVYNLPFSVRSSSGSSSNVDPTLEMVNQFENIDGTSVPLKLNNPDGSPVFYTNPTDLFKNKDPRLLGSVIVPFSTYRNVVIDVQAGIYDLGVKTEAGDYKSLYNPATHMADNTNGTIHIVGSNGFGGQEITQTGFYVRKYLDYTVDKSVVGNGSTQPFMVFRYGGILLNYAEAAVETNDISDAKWAINLIRDRAGIKLLDDADITIEKVRHERLVELAFENQRWWDYRRWFIADKVMNNTSFTALKPYYDLQAKAYRFETGTAGRWNKTFFSKVYYEQIDPGEIAKNPNLLQNPGY